MAKNNNRTHSMSRFWTLVVLLISLGAFIGTMVGCGNIEGDVTTNQMPVVEFTNVPANQDTFSFAPVIHWKGRDPDGFVEEYMYADIIDSSAILDPQYYVPFIPDEAWIRTEATSDTVYLLTETGRVTEHVFYLKCVDDRETESPVIYRTFYRSNRPPRVPEIKWFTNSDDGFAERINVTLGDPNAVPPIPPVDTLYSLDAITGDWPGLGFNWRSTDPDDRELYRIPLQFRYYLEKTPHDTVWEWVSQDWTTRQDLVFSGLETGHYIFTVWARDDGYEVSERAAYASFDVYKPSFEQSVLIFNMTNESPPGGAGRGNIMQADSAVGGIYRQLLLQASARYPNAEYFHYTARDTIKPFKSFLGRFKLVIKVSENFSGTDSTFESRFRDYVRVGGRLWVMGNYQRRNLVSNTTLALAESMFSGPTSGVTIPGNKAEFTAAISGVRDLPTLVIDTSKTGENHRIFWRGSYETYPCLPGIEILTAGSGAETAYYFSSFTDTASGDVTGEQAIVKSNIDTIYYPPTPVDCLIEIDRQRVLNVLRVENVTRGVRGQVQSLTNNVGSRNQTVVRVSYPYDEPWSITDSVVVDYQFQPYSDLHLRPVAIRYEKLVGSPAGSFDVRYRVAVFTFPLYYLDNTNGEVTRMFNSMLDWFFYPFAH